MPNSHFRFKQFTIEQASAAMKVGTDGVLLGAWAKLNPANRILDVGSGTGLIAIMAAQRNTTAIIDTVEIDEQSYRQAIQNINNSAWGNRINIYHQSFQQFSCNCTNTYNSIISNPPYFNNSLQSSVIERNKARHSEYLPHTDLLIGVKKLLSINGTFSVILPSIQEADFNIVAQKNDLFCNKKLWIKANVTKNECVRVMLEYGFNYNKQAIENSICIETEQRGVYTNEYMGLTKDFYLKF